MSGSSTPMKRLVIGISGASGVIYGVRALEVLKAVPDIETHLVLSAAAKRTLVEETDRTVESVEALADVVHSHRDIGAAIASGSFRTEGMLVAPCSIKTLAGIAHCYSDNLLTRAADVTLKERRILVMMARETPLTLAHLRNMTLATEMGARIMPPVPAFYTHPKTVQDIIDHTVWRVLDQFGLAHEDAYERWNGLKGAIAGH